MKTNTSKYRKNFADGRPIEHTPSNRKGKRGTPQEAKVWEKFTEDKSTTKALLKRYNEYLKGKK